MSYSDIKNLPIVYRRWYIERLIKHYKNINQKNKPVDNLSSNNNHNIMGIKNHHSSNDNKEDIKKIERFFKKFSE